MFTAYCSIFNERPKLAAPARVILAILCLVLNQSEAKAQVINFDVPGGIGGVNYSGQGAAAGSGTNWNPIAYQATTTGALLSDGVTASLITLTDTSRQNYVQGRVRRALLTDWKLPLFMRTLAWSLRKR
jgi:hypothetical protein